MGEKKSIFNRMKSFLQQPSVPISPDITTIWHHHILAIDPSITIDLKDPLVDLSQCAADLCNRPAAFPLVVGDNGQVLAASGGRLISGGGDKSLYLTYHLKPRSANKIILKLRGRDTQTIEVFRDDRKNSKIPIVLFLPKPIKTP